jgi:uncharacterized protein YdhG (YjbR/CyaY superfamily)
MAMTMPIDPRVDKYIAQFPADIQQRLNILRKIFRRTFLTAIEDISYKMPAYRLTAGKMPVIFFSAFKKHIGIFAVLSPNDSKLYKQIEPYNTGKGTLRFDNDKPLPVILIEQVLADHHSRLIK